MIPSLFFSLSVEEQAFIMGAIAYRVEKEAKEAREAERKAGKGKKSGRGRRRR